MICAAAGRVCHIVCLNTAHRIHSIKRICSNSLAISPLMQVWYLNADVFMFHNMFHTVWLLCYISESNVLYMSFSPASPEPFSGPAKLYNKHHDACVTLDEKNKDSSFNHNVVLAGENNRRVV